MSPIQQLKRAAVYVRQSQTEQGSISAELQEANCRKLAERYGWDITKVYDDLDITGGSTKKRDAYKELWADFKAGKFDILLADDLSRFNRNTAESALLHDQIPTATWKEGIQENRLMTDIFSAFNADYLRKISDRWSDALKRRLAAGLTASGSFQFGYRRFSQDGKTEFNSETRKPKGYLEKYVQHKEEAAILTEAYDRYTKGEGARTICEDFNNRGLASAGPSGWHTGGFFDLLDKEFYAGKIIHQGQEFPGAHEPILDKAQWAAYRKARESRKMQDRPRNTKWMLHGLVFCGHCGGKMLSHMARGVPNLLCANYNAGGKTVCPGMFRKRSVVQTAVWWWLGSHLDEWASAMPTDEEARIAAEKAVADAEAAKDEAQANVSNLLSRAVRFNMADGEISGPLAEFRAELADAQAVLDEALGELGSLTPASDVHEQISKGSLLMGFDEDPEAEPSEAATAQFREALSKIIAGVIVLPPTGASPRDPKRKALDEIRVVPVA